MAVSIEQVRNLLREADIRYIDEAKEEKEKKSWRIEFWLPTRKYRFRDRVGFNTVINLNDEEGETGDFNFMLMGVFAILDTQDMSKLPELLLRINRLNDRSKVIKWSLSTGQNPEDEVEDIRVHVTVEIWFNASEMSKDQFWRSHSALYHTIENNWEHFAEDLGIRIRPKSTEISQKEPEDLTVAYKEKLVEMFGEFLEGQFENS